MNNRTKGIVAGVAGLALLTGGSTFALWKDEATLRGGVIRSGTLDVELLRGPSWVDASDDRADAGHAISLESFRMVPGDTIRGTFPIDAALEGDNMVAALDVTVAGAPVPQTEYLFAEGGVTITYSILGADGRALPGFADVPLGTGSSLGLRSLDNTAAVDADLRTLPARRDDRADLTVVVTATFDPAADAREFAGAAGELQALGVSLTQNRPAGAR